MEGCGQKLRTEVANRSADPSWGAADPANTNRARLWCDPPLHRLDSRDGVGFYACCVLLSLCRRADAADCVVSLPSFGPPVPSPEGGSGTVLVVVTVVDHATIGQFTAIGSLLLVHCHWSTAIGPLPLVQCHRAAVGRPMEHFLTAQDGRHTIVAPPAGKSEPLGRVELTADSFTTGARAPDAVPARRDSSARNSTGITSQPPTPTPPTPTPPPPTPPTPPPTPSTHTGLPNSTMRLHRREQRHNRRSRRPVVLSGR